MPGILGLGGFGSPWGGMQTQGMAQNQSQAPNWPALASNPGSAFGGQGGPSGVGGGQGGPPWLMQQGPQGNPSTSWLPRPSPQSQQNQQGQNQQGGGPPAQFPGQGQGVQGGFPGQGVWGGGFPGQGQGMPSPFPGQGQGLPSWLQQMMQGLGQMQNMPGMNPGLNMNMPRPMGWMGYGQT